MNSKGVWDSRETTIGRHTEQKGNRSAYLVVTMMSGQRKEGRRGEMGVAQLDFRARSNDQRKGEMVKGNET
jgi:hypothetical protein